MRFLVLSKTTSRTTESFFFYFIYIFVIYLILYFFSVNFKNFISLCLLLWLFIASIVYRAMDEIKTTLLTPEILDDCLGDESCFHVIKHKRDITFNLNSSDENKHSKYIGNLLC